MEWGVGVWYGEEREVCGVGRREMCGGGRCVVWGGVVCGVGSEVCGVGSEVCGVGSEVCGMGVWSEVWGGVEVCGERRREVCGMGRRGVRRGGVWCGRREVCGCERHTYTRPQTIPFGTCISTHAVV